MRLRTLSTIVLFLILIYWLMDINLGKGIAPPSAELKQYLKYAITGAVVAFIGYLAMTRR